MAIADTITSMQTHTSNAYTMIENGTDLTGINKNLENLSTSIFKAFIGSLNNPDTLWGNLPKITGTGTNITLNNTIEAPMKIELSASELTQDATPTPSSPQAVHTISGSNTIRVMGKNIFNKQDFINDMSTHYQETKTIDGEECICLGRVSSTTTSNVYKINGTENTQYTLSMKYTNSNCAMIFKYSDNTTSSITLSTTSTLTNLTATSTANKTLVGLEVQCFGWYGSGSKLEIAKPMLEKGTTASIYEEYKGTDYSIDLTSKNLFTTRNNFSMITGYANYNVLGTNSLDVISTGNSYGYRYIRYQLNGLEVGKTYYVSAKFENSDKTTTSPLYVRNTADSSSLYANDGYTSGSKVSFTATETTAMIRFYASSGTAKINTCTWYDIMVSKDQNAEFVPYYDYGEYCKIGNYEDRIFKNISGDTDYSNTREEGAWYIKKNIGKVVLDGNMPLNYNGTAGQFYNTNQTNIPNYLLNTELLCNKLKYSNTSWVANALGITANNTFWIYVENGPSTFNDMNNWLNTELPEVYYVLATPTYTKIEGTLANQLEAVKKSKDGVTNISQVNNDLSFNLSVQAIEE